MERALRSAGVAIVLAAGLCAQEPGSRRSALTLCGEVRDEGGQPVVCAQVALWSPFASELRRVQTDGSGAFVLPGIPADEPTWLRLSAPGFCPLARELRPGDGKSLLGATPLVLKGCGRARRPRPRPRRQADPERGRRGVRGRLLDGGRHGPRRSLRDRRPPVRRRADQRVRARLLARGRVARGPLRAGLRARAR